MIKIIKYFFESLIIYLFFLIIKILGLSISRFLFSFIFKKIGPIIRSRNTIKKNLNIFSNKISEQKMKEIELNMAELKDLTDGAFSLIVQRKLIKYYDYSNCEML